MRCGKRWRLGRKEEKILDRKVLEKILTQLDLLSSQKVWVGTLAVISADTENLKIGSKKEEKHKALRAYLKTVP